MGRLLSSDNLLKHPRQNRCLMPKHQATWWGCFNFNKAPDQTNTNRHWSFIKVLQGLFEHWS